MKKVRLLKDAVLDDEECEKVKNQDKQKYELLLAVSNSLKNKIAEKIKAAREGLRDYLETTALMITDQKHCIDMFNEKQKELIFAAIIIDRKMQEFLVATEEKPSWNGYSIKVFYSIIDGVLELEQMATKGKLYPFVKKFNLNFADFKEFDKVAPALFPNYQYLLGASAKMEQQAEQPKQIVQSQQPVLTQPKVEEVKPKSREERMRDVELQFALSEDFVEHYDKILVDMEKQGDANFAKAGKALEDYVELILRDKQVYNHFECDEKDNYVRDEQGYAVLANRDKIADKDLKMLEKKFKNATHYAYKVLDLTENFQR